MKQKVMNDIAAAKLLMDVGSLVAFNYPEAIERTLRKKRKKN